MLHLTIQDILKIKKGEDYIDRQGNLIPNHELTLPSAKPRSYAYCSDTLYDESIIEFIEICGFALSRSYV
jgi:ribonuclease Z